MKKDEPTGKQRESFELSIQQLRVRLGGPSVALVAAAVAAILYAVAAHRC